RVGSNPKRGICIVKPLLRWWPTTFCRAGRRGSQQCLKSCDVKFSQPQSPCHANETLMLGWVNLTIRSDRQQLNLQEQLKQNTAARRGLRKRRHLSVEIDLRGLATIERRLRRNRLVGRKAQPLKELFGNADLVARDHAVSLTDRPHYGKGRLEELRLYPV